MRKILLTGMSSEQSFIPDENNGHTKLGPTRFHLVFNDGELHVPVSQEAVASVLEYMTEGERGEPQYAEEAPEKQAAPAPTVYNEEDDPSAVTDESGVDQV